MLDISKSTVGGIIRRFNCENRIESIPQKGQPKILDTRDKRNIIQKIEKRSYIKCTKISCRNF